MNRNIKSVREKMNFNDFILILLLMISFYRYSDVISYAIMLFWIVIALCKFALNGYRIDDLVKKNILKTVLKYNFGIKLVIYVYTICLIIFNITEKRFFSSNMQTFINAVSAIAIIYLYGKRALRNASLALICCWFFGFLVSLSSYGLIDVWDYLEFHDIAFSSGYLILYYIFTKKRWSLSDLKVSLVVLIIVLLAFKRIGIFALVIAVLVGKGIALIRMQSLKQKIIMIASYCAIVICYLYVYFIQSNALWEIFSYFHINSMGRNYYYRVLWGLYSFNISYLGLGRNACATIFSSDYSYMNVGNVHSDIFRMYIECGFILFGIWLFVYWRLFLKQIGHIFGYKCMEFLFICTIYTFVVYLTDNTELYLANQFFYMLVPMHFILANDEIYHESKKIRFHKGKVAICK